jgi:hypothetical protein
MGALLAATLCGALWLALGADRSAAQLGTGSGRGVVFLEVSDEDVVPGSLLDIRYRTKKGTLQGNADIYFAVRMPTGRLLYLRGDGIGPDSSPLRRDVAIADDETTPLVTLPVSGDLAFGTYTFYMALVHAGADPTDPDNWASGASEVAVSLAPLSPAQREVLQSRGNPDFLVVLWFAEALQKRESWLYLSQSPTRFGFVNGALVTEEAVADASGGPGPKVDPGLFTPQTTLEQLTAALGPAASATPVEDAPDHELVTYASGLRVVLREGRLSSALTAAP